MDKTSKAKTFKVKILWGMESSREEDTEPMEYAFATKAELDAFLQGVDEANGWMDYEIVKEVDCKHPNARLRPTDRSTFICGDCNEEVR